jgi:hypothetical protein
MTYAAVSKAIARMEQRLQRNQHLCDLAKKAIVRAFSPLARRFFACVCEKGLGKGEWIWQIRLPKPFIL